MNEKVLKSLYDIKLAIEEIDTFFSTRDKRFDDYTNDLLLKREIERNLEIIGEAMNRILKEDPQISIDNAKRIVGLRNQIIHGYDSVSDENIWGIVINHLPKLKDEISKLIQ
ncbi:MAG TPA: HepT-like ribonuclease domain-containing protein [Bacteroidales bacterium]